jgi:plastocyanin
VPTRSRPAATALLLLTLTLAACQAASADRSAADAEPVSGVGDVTAEDLRFQPPAIQVPAGTEVTWHFEDGSVPHNVKGDDFGSGNQTKGVFSHRFDRPGEYRYTCTLHAGMDGRVVVTVRP